VDGQHYSFPLHHVHIVEPYQPKIEITVSIKQPEKYSVTVNCTSSFTEGTSVTEKPCLGDVNFIVDIRTPINKLIRVDMSASIVKLDSNEMSWVHTYLYTNPKGIF